MYYTQIVRFRCLACCSYRKIAISSWCRSMHISYHRDILSNKGFNPPTALELEEVDRVQRGLFVIK